MNHLEILLKIQILIRQVWGRLHKLPGADKGAGHQVPEHWAVASRWLHTKQKLANVSLELFTLW